MSDLRSETVCSTERMDWIPSAGMELHSSFSFTPSLCLRMNSRASQSFESSSVQFRLITRSSDLSNQDIM